MPLLRSHTMERAILSVAALLAFPTAAICQQECLKQAWAAYEKKDYPAAISAADQCIDDFGPKAEKEQAALEAKRTPVPPTGDVSNAADKKAIFERWAVNDVSASYFVKGRSAEYLYKRGSSAHKKVAEEAYQGAIKLSYGRVFDPKRGFWSPSEAASERMPLK